MSNPESISTASHFTQVTTFPATIGDLPNAPEYNPELCRSLHVVGSGTLQVLREDGVSESLTVSDGEYPIRVKEVTAFDGDAVIVYW